MKSLNENIIILACCDERLQNWNTHILWWVWPCVAKTGHILDIAHTVQSLISLFFMYLYSSMRKCLQTCACVSQVYWRLYQRSKRRQSHQWRMSPRPAVVLVGVNTEARLLFPPPKKSYVSNCVFFTLCLCHFLDSPPRGPADTKAPSCTTAPDSSTVCVSSAYVPYPSSEDIADNYPTQTPCTSSSSCTHPSADDRSTSAGLSSSTAAPPFPAQSPPSRSKPSSPSSSCPTLSLPPSPAIILTQTSSVGQRRKGLARKVRRNQRQRGRQICTPATREGEKRLEEGEKEEAEGEERMEEDIEQDEERMEEETSGETAAHQQWCEVQYSVFLLNFYLRRM